MKLLGITCTLILSTLLLSCQSIPERSTLARADIVKPLVIIEPRLPTSQRPDNLHSVITVEFVITPDGRVVSPEIIDTKFSDYFNSNFIKAFSMWRFQPSMNGQSAVYSIAKMKVLFSKDKSEIASFNKTCDERKNPCAYVSIGGFSH